MICLDWFDELKKIEKLRLNTCRSKTFSREKESTEKYSPEQIIQNTTQITLNNRKNDEA